MTVGVLAQVTVGEACEAFERVGVDPELTLGRVIAGDPDALNLLHRILGLRTQGDDNHLEVA